jgi:plasmid stabilization system protein ParE
MSLPVVLRPEASRDVEDARDYLEPQRPGLGEAFLALLNEVLTRIGAMPKIYALAWPNVRAARVWRFPYVVYYRVHDDRAELLAVMHGGQHGSAWQTRAGGS